METDEDAVCDGHISFSPIPSPRESRSKAPKVLGWNDGDLWRSAVAATALLIVAVLALLREQLTLWSELRRALPLKDDADATDGATDAEVRWNGKLGSSPFAAGDRACAKRYHWRVSKLNISERWSTGAKELAAQVGRTFLAKLHQCEDSTWAYNPMLQACVPHMSEMLTFALLPEMSEEKNIVKEFLGNKLKWAASCAKFPGEDPFSWLVYSRLVPCIRNQKYATRANVIDYPIVDDEYFQWTDMFTAIRSVRHHRHFAMVDIGSRDGTWITRAVAALRASRQFLTYTATAVEPNKAHLKFLGENLALNSIGEDVARIHYACAGSGLAFFDAVAHGSDNASAAVPERALCPETVTLMEILAPTPRVDWLLIDADGAERHLFVSELDREALSRKVVRLHVRLHSAQASGEVLSSLRQLDFHILAHVPFATIATTEVGKVYFRLGTVIAVNSRFVDVCS